MDVTGECIRAGNRILTVAGVMDEDGETVMVPVTEGKVEYLSVEFDGRSGGGGEGKAAAGGVLTAQEGLEGEGGSDLYFPRLHDSGY